MLGQNCTLLCTYSSHRAWGKPLQLVLYIILTNTYNIPHRRNTLCLNTPTKKNLTIEKKSDDPAYSLER